MIKPEMMPDAAWRAAMSAYHKTLRKNPAMAWQEAIAAALSAWPGMRMMVDIDTGDDAAIKLPLPQENSDDK